MLFRFYYSYYALEVSIFKSLNKNYLRFNVV
jgi:hypothetical protein